MTATTVVTGIGITAPNGLGTEDYWKATLDGRSGIGPVTRFDASQYPATLAGEVPGFVAEEHIPSRLMPQTDHMTRLAMTAAAWAIDDAGVDAAALPEYGMGVVTAASGGAVEFGQRELQNLWSKGKEYVSAYQSFAWFYAVNTGQISIRHKMRGPSGVLLTEQAGGIDSLGHARRHIRKGIPLVVAGGVDAALCPWGWVPQLASGRMSTAGDPARAYLPFSPDACGYVAGEGGAILVTEDAGSARERRAPQVYGEIAGYAATLDPAPGSARPPGLGRAARNALADAGLTPADIDVVFADAAGVPGPGPGGGRGDHRPLRPARRARHRPQDHDRPAARRRRGPGRGHRPARPSRRRHSPHRQRGSPGHGLPPRSGHRVTEGAGPARRAGARPRSRWLQRGPRRTTACRDDGPGIRPERLRGHAMPITTTHVTLTDLTRMLRESAGEEEGVDLDGDVIDTPFIELGYDSLALLQVIGEIQREYGVEIPDDAVVDAETPRALLDLINAGSTSAA